VTGVTAPDTFASLGRNSRVVMDNRNNQSLMFWICTEKHLLKEGSGNHLCPLKPANIATETTIS
jgi:hypothetical protein